MENNMDFLFSSWAIVIALVAVAVVVCLGVYRFFKMSTADQMDSVREWLLWAVTEAERELGGGTGKLKLRQVYDLFVVRFPWLVRMVSFDTFSVWVDEALEEMRVMLNTNDAVQEYVAGDLR